VRCKMGQQELKVKLQDLEEEHELLVNEMEEIDYLLRSIGFPEGLKSIRDVAKEFLKDELDS